MYYIMMISLLLVSLVYAMFMLLFYKSKFYMDSVIPYECGFNPSSSTRLTFSYRFFLISILFIIFDVEIVLLLPVPFGGGSILLIWFFFFFMLILIMGLLYEYVWGSLDW
uniref:NADH-ubiquinone oxidoreductase chain 3 n=1 Tax=Philodromus sp. TaxID=2975155 RepID=A0A977Q6U1_9ARAC|nr:NADH dehydrogenase subunit 3 [Philodromus sp.]